MSEAIRMLMSAHYYLMGNPRFWYKKGLQDASRILCVMASDMRFGMVKVATPANLQDTKEGSPMTVQEIVMKAYPDAELYAYPHGKVRIESPSEGILSDMACRGTREERSKYAWASAFARLLEKQERRDLQDTADPVKHD